MANLVLKKSTNIVLFDGLILGLAALFLMPEKHALLLGVSASLVGTFLCFWSKRYLFTRKNFVVGGPYLYVRYPYLLGHFIFVFGLVIQVRSFIFLIVSVLLLGYVYSRIIRYSEKGKYGSVEASYIYYRSSVPAFVPQLIPYSPELKMSEPQKIDLMTILAQDGFTELYRILSLVLVSMASLAMLYTHVNPFAIKGVLLTGVVFMYLHKLYFNSDWPRSRRRRLLS